jgi:hypothetical protein
MILITRSYTQNVENAPSEFVPRKTRLQRAKEELERDYEQQFYNGKAPTQIANAPEPVSKLKVEEAKLEAAKSFEYPITRSNAYELQRI